MLLQLYYNFTALFLAHTARAQHISGEDGLHCPLQIRHLDFDLDYFFGDRNKYHVVMTAQ